MLKMIDKVWFFIADRIKGLYYGYCAANNKGYQEAWEEAYAIGKRNESEKNYLTIVRNLSEKRPDIASAEFQLGYAHAAAIAKGEVV